MIISIKQLFIVTALILSICFLMVLSTQNLHAETGSQKLLNKGEQCVTWIRSNEISRQNPNASSCLLLCKRYGTKASAYPHLLTDEGIKKCHDAYSEVEKHVTGIKNPVTTDQAPETIEEMVEDMNIFAQKFQVMVNNAKTLSEERQANGGYRACVGGAKRIQALDVATAKPYWKLCTNGKRPNSTQGNAE